ncbi:MAG TPA: acyl carrier protein [Ktedonobacterales bacterium]
MQNSTALGGMNLIQRQIHEYVVTNFLFGGTATTFTDDTPLVEDAILDETGVLELVLFIEETYGAQVNEADVTPENFGSVNAITSYIYRLLANS